MNFYRYGFNGQEKDNELKDNGNSYDFGARIYDPRLGRWLSLDPLSGKYPYLTPYNFVNNSPLFKIEKDGRDFELVVDHKNKTITVVANFYVTGELATDKLITAINTLNGNSEFKYSVENNEGKFVQYDVKFDFNPVLSQDPINDAKNDPIGNAFTVVKDGNTEINHMGKKGTLNKLGAAGLNVTGKYVYLPETSSEDTDVHEILHSLTGDFHSKLITSYMYKEENDFPGEMTKDIMEKMFKVSVNSEKPEEYPKSKVTETNATVESPDIIDNIGNVIKK